jgi:hypothetical protein
VPQADGEPAAEGEAMSLLSLDDQLQLQPLRPGSEWYEALVATGVRYPVPWHGHPSRWEWGMTAYGLGMAQLRGKQIAKVAKELTPDQRAVLWSDTSEAGQALRKALR